MAVELEIYHFNDVYHIGDSSLIARFANFVNKARSSKNSDRETYRFTVFSGDVFSPSTESSILQGEHMVPVLNQLGIDVACYGNHDFDFGEARLHELSKRTNFPWVLSNVRRHAPQNVEVVHESLPAGAQEYIIRDVAGYKIDILSPVDVSKRLAKTLRVDYKCDNVIAITHMRLIEDLGVANATTDSDYRVDMLLGGHDHEVLTRSVGDTDANPEVIQQDKKNSDVVTDGRQWTDITQDPAYHSIPESCSMMDTLSSIHRRITQTVQHPLFHSSVPLDGRSTIIRSQETNLGNLIADAVRAFYDSDIALVNSGGIRCDRIIKATANGENSALTVKDMIDILPFTNPFVVKRLSGTQILHALANSLSDAHTDGRFFQLSGLRIRASWSLPSMHRLLSAHFLPHDDSAPSVPIDAKQTYTVAMVSFIAAGFDGYVDMVDTETLVGEEGAMTDTALMLRIMGYENEQGGPGEEEKKESHRDDETDAGIQRARKAVLIGHHLHDSLPIVGPKEDGRIEFLDKGATAEARL
ncbi:MAG: hypothetical protein Q9224_004766 [Gallowayella concinna]